MSVLTTQEPRTRARRMAWPVIGASVTVAAAFYIRAVNPNNGGYPLCPLKLVTGIDCPACGGLRCVHSLMNGDISAAMDQNLLAVFVLPMVAIWAVFALRDKWRGDDAPVVVSASGEADSALAARAAALRALVIVMIIATVLFTILRNIPGIGFLPSGAG